MTISSRKSNTNHCLFDDCSYSFTSFHIITEIHLIISDKILLKFKLQSRRIMLLSHIVTEKG
ncbi:hypothetical protein X975_05469, partial [Stegodyphus mimosarum]